MTVAAIVRESKSLPIGMIQMCLMQYDSNVFDAV